MIDISKYFRRPKKQPPDPDELLAEYRGFLLSRQYARTTIIKYMRGVEAFLRQYPNPMEVTERRVEEYLAGFSGKSFSYTTAAFYAVSSLFECLAFHGKSGLKINHRLLRSLIPIHRPKTVPKILADDDINALFREIRDLNSVIRCRDYCIFLCLLHGLRAEEICKLDVSDIRIDGRGVTRKMVIRVKGKRGKERIVVSEKQGGMEWAWSRYIKMRDGIQTDIAFPALLGKGNTKRLTTNGLYRIIERYAKKAGVKPFSAHVWRHTTAVRLLERGIALKEIQYRLGHESIATTEKYLGAASILQMQSWHCNWISSLKRPDARYRRWRLP